MSSGTVDENNQHEDEDVEMIEPELAEQDEEQPDTKMRHIRSSRSSPSRKHLKPHYGLRRANKHQRKAMPLNAGVYAKSPPIRTCLLPPTPLRRESCPTKP